MKPSRIIRAISWRYALGELVLIVAGILIALTISDWNDRRLQRADELALLNDVRTSLSKDLVGLRASSESVAAAMAQIVELQALLKQPPTDTERLDALFGTVYGLRVTNLNTTTYETLKSLGLKTVSNPELRSGIAHIYDHFYQRIRDENDIEQQAILGLFRPYYLEHFHTIRPNVSATPLDYEQVMNDPYYRNLVDYRLTLLRMNQGDSYNLAIAEIEKVIALLNAELDGWEG